MGSEETSKMSEKTINSNNHTSDAKDKKYNGTKMLQPPRKVYTQRNSVLTDLMEVNHLQSVYNIMVATFGLLLLYSILYYIAAPDVFWADIEIMKWATSKGFILIKSWLLCNLFAVVVLGEFRGWVHVRNKIHTKIADTLFLVLYIATLTSMFVVTASSTLKHSLPPITAFVTMIEQVRIFMKIYSFVRESTPRVLKYKPTKDGDQSAQLYPSLSHYLYYLFAPVMIYRDSYPRRKDTDWMFVFQTLFKFFACIFIAYCAFMRFIVDIFQYTALRQFSLAECALIFAGATFVGATMMFLVFYCVLHSWLNFFAEMIKFGDREFYQDWWNSTSFSQYYRKWNLVVHDWLYNYIYVETQKLGFNRTFSMITVFLVSALVHEYIIGLALGFFYPVLMVIYSTVGVVIMFVTQRRTGQMWNILMWGMLFSGWGVIVCLYGSEWYARVNCPGSQDPVEDFFRPRSWNKSCRIIKF
ncbi:sterol O-acyltransferase 1 [Parasteatoda tepidariorum]|uniref:sterol O-acyltransferase 1 n=1 Tax=Parasteatoda tepidariorum TaxID=114398 RepID=UPI00077F88A5|nr:sterol O-acyltransferase 1 [Parasteatoda tepidariorum]